jgi:hypothetical protein
MIHITKGNLIDSRHAKYRVPYLCQLIPPHGVELCNHRAQASRQLNKIMLILLHHLSLSYGAFFPLYRYRFTVLVDFDMVRVAKWTTKSAPVTVFDFFNHVPVPKYSIFTRALENDTGTGKFLQLPWEVNLWCINWKHEYVYWPRNFSPSYVPVRTNLVPYHSYLMG